MQRTVSLLPSTPEMVCRLRLRERLLGISQALPAACTDCPC
jgi:hypothetical protein